MNRTLLRLIFGSIFLSLFAYTTYASTQQSVFDWQGMVAEPDKWWTIATMMDAYFGFLTFYVWVFYKESSGISRTAWFIAIMLLGNMAMSIYVLRQIAKLGDDESLENILLRRHA
jgi:hypothetical protein